MVHKTPQICPSEIMTLPSSLGDFLELDSDLALTLVPDVSVCLDMLQQAFEIAKRSLMVEITPGPVHPVIKKSDDC